MSHHRWIVSVAVVGGLLIALSSACDGINPCPGQLTCSDHTCCPVGEPFNCNGKCYGAAAGCGTASPLLCAANSDDGSGGACNLATCGGGGCCDGIACIPQGTFCCGTGGGGICPVGTTCCSTGCCGGSGSSGGGSGGSGSGGTGSSGGSGGGAGSGGSGSGPVTNCQCPGQLECSTVTGNCVVRSCTCYYVIDGSDGSSAWYTVNNECFMCQQNGIDYGDCSAAANAAAQAAVSCQ